MVSSPLSCPGMSVIVCKDEELPWSLMSLKSTAFAGQAKQAGGQIFLSKISSCTVWLQPGMRLTCIHNISIYLSSPPSETPY